jgi:hypothetical protein
MSSLWSKVSNFVHGAAVKIADAFVAIFGKDASHQFAQGALAVLKTAAGKIALDAVEAIEAMNPGADGASKRSQAFTKVASDFKAQGIQASESIIGMLIELAVQYLKGTIVAA